MDCQANHMVGCKKPKKMGRLTGLVGREIALL